MSATANDLCPRCGQTFQCGVQGDTPCPCTTVNLSAALQQRLRAQFQGCLCLRCLVDLAEGAPLLHCPDKPQRQGAP